MHRWWKIQYANGDSLEVACFPDVSLAAVMAMRPDAVSSAPLVRNLPEQVAACDTCAHRLRSGACGEPVAAGLLDVKDVIRYHGNGGASCVAWLARLDRDLEDRIRRMAERWCYAEDDLMAALSGARTDPDGWRNLVNDDERENVI